MLKLIFLLFFFTKLTLGLADSDTPLDSTTINPETLETTETFVNINFLSATAMHSRIEHNVTFDEYIFFDADVKLIEEHKRRNNIVFTIQISNITNDQIENDVCPLPELERSFKVKFQHGGIVEPQNTEFEVCDKIKLQILDSILRRPEKMSSLIHTKVKTFIEMPFGLCPNSNFNLTKSFKEDINITTILNNLKGCKYLSKINGNDDNGYEIIEGSTKLRWLFDRLIGNQKIGIYSKSFLISLSSDANEQITQSLVIKILSQKWMAINPNSVKYLKEILEE